MRDGSYSGQNFGTAGRLLVKKAVSGGGYIRTAYFQFNLTGTAPISVRRPPTHRQRDGRLVGSVDPVAAYGVASNWTELGISLRQRPRAGGTPLATVTVTGTTLRTYQFDLTTYLKQQQALGNRTVSVAIAGVSTTFGTVTFNSRESAFGGSATAAQQRHDADTHPHADTHPDADAHADSDSNTHADSDPDSHSDPDSDVGDTAAGGGCVRPGWAVLGSEFRRRRATDRQDAAAGGGYVRTAYLQFNLAGAAPITSAVLRLTGGEVPGATNEPSIIVAAYGVVSNWTENGITSASAPPFGGTPLALTTVSGTTTRVYQFDLTAYLQQQQVLGVTTVSVAIAGIATTNGQVTFNSREAATGRPQLLINGGGTDVDAEPGPHTDANPDSHTHPDVDSDPNSDARSDRRAQRLRHVGQCVPRQRVQHLPGRVH